MRSGPQMGRVATLLLPPGGSLTLHRVGQNEKWPTNGSGGYITHAKWGIPYASTRVAESDVAQNWAGWLDNRFCLTDTQHFRAVVKSTSGPL